MKLTKRNPTCFLDIVCRMLDYNYMPKKKKNAQAVFDKPQFFENFS